MLKLLNPQATTEEAVVRNERPHITQLRHSTDKHINQQILKKKEKETLARVIIAVKVAYFWITRD